jgi:HNH endonuclease
MPQAVRERDDGASDNDPRMTGVRMSTNDPGNLDRIVAEARRAAEQRAQGYREQALKIYPWICGRCAREFTRGNLRELTVHHRDHNHDNNPPDGSNWELLCLYCHDNEHQRQLEAAGGEGMPSGVGKVATHSPFASLKDLLAGKQAPK